MTHHHVIKTPKIALKPVSSDSIKAIGYDAPSRTLRVQFLTGQTYDYHAVPPAQHEALMKAESHGRHFTKNVLGKFKYTKLP